MNVDYLKNTNKLDDWKQPFEVTNLNIPALFNFHFQVAIANPYIPLSYRFTSSFIIYDNL